MPLLDLWFAAKPLDPVETVPIHPRRGGESIRLPIYVDPSSINDQHYLKCDLCSKFIKIGKGKSTKKMVDHRGEKDCTDYKIRFERDILVWRETRKVEKALEESWPTGLVSNAAIDESDELDNEQDITNTPEPLFNTLLDRAQDGTSSENTDPANLCPGVRVHWTPGSVWDTYAYRQHQHPSIAWSLVSSDGEYVVLRSKKCSGSLDTNVDLDRGNCSACASLIGSETLNRFIERATGDAPLHTPYMYLNTYQSEKLLAYMSKKMKRLEKKIQRLQKTNGRLQEKISDYQRLIMLLSQHRIGGVSTILAIGIQNGSSPMAIYSQLQRAIDGLYRPRSGWTQREFDIAFLAKALGGPQLLYMLQKVENSPSYTTLKRNKPIPELLVSTSAPDSPEVDINITSILGQEGRKPPKNPLIGQTLMIDGVALEEACRYDHGRGHILGICREHSSRVLEGLKINSYQDILKLSQALYENQICHHGKDGTVGALAPVTGTENYFPSAVTVSPSCKSEVGDELLQWVTRFLDIYHIHPDGEKKHGPIFTLATDGESSFRAMRYKLGVSEAIDPRSNIGRRLYHLPGFNRRTGPRGLVTTSDPKHIIKRFASMIRSTKGVQVGDTTLGREDFKSALTIMSGLSDSEADVLLNPADKQNVPVAVRLLKELLDGSQRSLPNIEPNFSYRLRKIRFLVTLLSYFIHPFVDTELSLSHQLRSLSTYAHLLTAMYLKHHGNFMNTALFADSQSVVKHIFYTATRLQLLDPQIEYHILFEGSDRLEGIFSNVRTQDHSRNFDVLQLAHKLSVGAEINAIFERNPDLYQGHIRRNLKGSRRSDHINPKSWTGNVEVGHVNITEEYLAGRHDADQLLDDFFSDLGHSVSWDTLFSDPNSNIDHLRPEGAYVGSRAADSDPDDDDTDPARGNLRESAIHTDNDILDQQGAVNDEFSDFETDEAESEEPSIANSGGTSEDTVPLEPILNPSLTARRSPYLDVGGPKQRHIDSLVAEHLVSDRAHKSIQRNLRVRDVTLAESIQNRVNDLNTDGLSDTSDLIKRGDLGAFLVQLSNRAICLAVGEIINFRKPSSKRDISFVKASDLAVESGPKMTTIIAQVLGLSPAAQDSSSLDATREWLWTQKYLRVHPDAHGVTSQKTYTLRIQGPLFIPLGPSINLDNERVVWSFKHTDLVSAMEGCWNSLAPDDNAILTNIEKLPRIIGDDIGLPYSFMDGAIAATLVILNPPINLSAVPKHATSDKIACKICSQSNIKVPKMREHVGKHILRALRVRDIDMEWITGTVETDPMENDNITPHIAINPCGWCGLEGCKTQLTIRPGKAVTIASNCEYHYSGLRYSMAMISSESSPCSNVPLNCSLCGQTFWKYNFIHHMLGDHLDPETENLPPVPIDLRVSTHITRKEEINMGVEDELTEKYRNQWQIPNSDALEEPPNPDTASTAPPTSPKTMPLTRKRAYSAALSSGSTTRLPPISKVLRM